MINFEEKLKNFKGDRAKLDKLINKVNKKLAEKKQELYQTEFSKLQSKKEEVLKLTKGKTKEDLLGQGKHITELIMEGE